MIDPANLARVQLGDKVKLTLPDGSHGNQGHVIALHPTTSHIDAPLTYRHQASVVIKPDTPLAAWHNVPLDAYIDVGHRNPLAFWRVKPDYALLPKTEFALSSAPAAQK